MTVDGWERMAIPKLALSEQSLISVEYKRPDTTNNCCLNAVASTVVVVRSE